jgi:hypothetical protein
MQHLVFHRAACEKATDHIACNKDCNPFDAMRADLEAERRALTKHWSKRDKHIDAVVENMAGMVGDFQAISGNALKGMPALKLVGPRRWMLHLVGRWAGTQEM